MMGPPSRLWKKSSVVCGTSRESSSQGGGNLCKDGKIQHGVAFNHSFLIFLKITGKYGVADDVGSAVVEAYIVQMGGSVHNKFIDVIPKRQ